jgi:hypothetical protein
VGIAVAMKGRKSFNCNVLNLVRFIWVQDAEHTLVCCHLQSPMRGKEGRSIPAPQDSLKDQERRVE